MKKIKLTQGKETLVDDEDYPYLNEHKWYALRVKNRDEFYAVRNGPIDSSGKNKKIYMHREITNAPKEKPVDHINRNPLDNRKENLRVCTHQENQMNRGKSKDNKSGYKGVSYHKKAKHMHNELSKPWNASIRFNGKSIYIGCFAIKEEVGSSENTEIR